MILKQFGAKQNNQERFGAEYTIKESWTLGWGIKRYGGLGHRQDTQTSSDDGMLLVCTHPSATTLLHARILLLLCFIFIDVLTSVKMEGKKRSGFRLLHGLYVIRMHV